MNDGEKLKALLAELGKVSLGRFRRYYGICLGLGQADSVTLEAAHKAGAIDAAEMQTLVDDHAAGDLLPRLKWQAGPELP